MKRDEINVAGIPVQVVSQKEAEEANMLVCGFSSNYRDDVQARCRMCDRIVYHRPHAPVKPPRICMDCVVTMLKGGDQ
jgi:hypothetical protein